MTSPPNKGNGRGINFLRSLIGHQGDDCIIWPMTRSRGYGTVGLNGKLHKAHRIMCELAGKETVTNLAKRFGVDRSTIRQIQAGKIWTRLRSPEQDHVVNTITKAGGTLRYTQIALAAGIKESSVSTLLRKLIRDGGLVKRGLGVYAVPPSAFI
jgi:hypothetical protein